VQPLSEDKSPARDFCFGFAFHPEEKQKMVSRQKTAFFFEITIINVQFLFLLEKNCGFTYQ